MLPGKKIFLCVFLLFFFTGLVVFSLKKEQQQPGTFNREPGSTRVKLGKYLFYDRRLSVNHTRSCATCHNQEFAFTDGYKKAIGAFADVHQRNTQPLFNLGYLKYLTAADSSVHSALDQIKNPLYNDHPIEMGIKGHEEKILLPILQDKKYKSLFAESFPGENDPISWKNIEISISDFLYTIVSDHSPFDQYKKGDSGKLSARQKRGMQLFFSNELKCSSCHGGFNFSTPTVTNQEGRTIFYFNTGLYNIDGKGAYPDNDNGLYQYTHKRNDIGKFRVPSLRNLAFTAPYLHDGSASSLREVIDIYRNGGRNIHKGMNKGDGRLSPNKDPRVTGFKLSNEDGKNLVDFLLSLTDSSLTRNSLFANPFTEDETSQLY